MKEVAWPVRGMKVVLRPFTRVDITPDYLAWLNDPVTMRFSNQRFRRHDAESSLRYLQGFEDSPNLFLAIDSVDGRRLGTMTAYVATHHGTADLGILIGERSVWGQGCGLDAWQALMNTLLRDVRLRKVTGGTLDCNHAMLAIFRKSGMHLEGRRERQEIVDGDEHDILYYARFAGA
jgi:[ribosomal protein S5]-alanine N-acetyltransferase